MTNKSNEEYNLKYKMMMMKITIHQKNQKSYHHKIHIIYKIDNIKIEWCVYFGDLNSELLFYIYHLRISGDFVSIISPLGLHYICK